MSHATFGGFPTDDLDEPLPWWCIALCPEYSDTIFASFETTAARKFDRWCDFDDACFFSRPEDAAEVLDRLGLPGEVVAVLR